MFDIKINKVFVDPRTGQDMYVLSIQLGDVYYNLNVTKEQFEKKDAILMTTSLKLEEKCDEVKTLKEKVRTAKHQLMELNQLKMKCHY